MPGSLHEARRASDTSMHPGHPSCRIIPPMPPAASRSAKESSSIMAQLDAIEKDGGDGELRFGKGRELHVSSLDKPYFPEDGLTKGGVMRYYAEVAPYMLPHLVDRPLSLTRHPEGIHGHTFYQQNAPKGVPEEVRVEELAVKGGDEALRIVGCDLPTLLYLVQMGTIVVHTWFSRIDSLDEPDLSLIDLDPGKGVEFGTVVALARTVRSVTDELGLHSALKTSGSRGIHIGIPLPKGSDYETSAALADRIAAEVVQKMPEVATLERRIAKRPAGSILVDVNQNARGKTMVAPYALRAREGATVSAPLKWTEAGSRLDMSRFTARTMARRLARTGDLWGDALRRRNTVRAVEAALRT